MTSQRLQKCILTAPYLISDAIDVIVAAVTDNAMMARLVDLDFHLTRVGNGRKAVALVVDLC